MIVIGITGTLGSGKGTVVEYLSGIRKFLHLSVRAFITEEILRRNLPVNRDNMVVVANDLRRQYGPSCITDTLYERAALSGQDCIIESIRATGEVFSLRKKENFFLLAIDADPEKRYNRIVERASETDHISFETFIANEQREMKSSEPYGQNLSACISMADAVVMNNGSKQELFSHIEGIIQKWNISQQ